MRVDPVPLLDPLDAASNNLPDLDLPKTNILTVPVLYLLSEVEDEGLIEDLAGHLSTLRLVIFRLCRSSML